MTREDEVMELSKDYADLMGLKVNPNGQVANNIIKGLVKIEAKKGALYCPCRMTTGNKELDKGIICPCVYHLSEIKESGHCHCQLFVKP